MTVARTRRDSQAGADVSDQPQPCPGGLRDRIRCTPGIAQLYRVGVFAAGALFIAIGLALVVLPGPLTIPPVLLGLWIWSTEFRFARRPLDAMRARAAVALRHARAHVLRSVLVTALGLAGAALAVWAIQHYELVAWAREGLLRQLLG